MPFRSLAADDIFITEADAARAEAKTAQGEADAEREAARVAKGDAERARDDFPTVEARGSLLANLELHPNLVGVARENPNPVESIASCRDGAVLVSSDDAGL